MAEYHVGYFVYKYSLIEALVLGKIIIVGENLGIGERFSSRPLIFPTLYKTMLFALWVLIFGISGRYEILARLLIMFVAFIPFFAFREAMQALGEVKLFDLFFRSRAAAESELSRGRTPPKTL